MSFKKDLLSRLRNTALTFLDGELITVVEHIQRPRLSKAQKEEANDILTRAEINARERRRRNTDAIARSKRAAEEIRAGATPADSD
jgi:hypothetical protein